MHTSSAGLAFISREEGLRLTPYNDSEGHATVGVGHLIHRGNVTDKDRRTYAGMSRADALRLLQADVAKVESVINQRVTRPLSQNEYDALVSLGFNIGTGGLAGSTVLRLLNKGDYTGAADAFLMWRKPAVLLPRRQRERSLFLKPVYKNKPNPLDYLTSKERQLVATYKTAAQRNDRAAKALMLKGIVEARKRIWRAAEHDVAGREAGWRKLHRRQRYHLLLDLTRGGK